MALVLAIEPDHHQASAVRRLISERHLAELILVDTKDAAVTAIAEQIPDLILVTAWLDPGDEDELVGWLHTLDDASHLRTLTIPQLAAPPKSHSWMRRLFKPLARRGEKERLTGCDPAIFAEEIATYLKRAVELKSERKATADVVAIEAERPQPPAYEPAPDGRADSGNESAGHPRILTASEAPARLRRKLADLTRALSAPGPPPDVSPEPSDAPTPLADGSTQLATAAEAAAAQTRSLRPNSTELEQESAVAAGPALESAAPDKPAVQPQAHVESEAEVEPTIVPASQASRRLRERLKDLSLALPDLTQPQEASVSTGSTEPTSLEPTGTGSSEEETLDVDNLIVEPIEQDRSAVAEQRPPEPPREPPPTLVRASEASARLRGKLPTLRRATVDSTSAPEPSAENFQASAPIPRGAVELNASCSSAAASIDDALPVSSPMPLAMWAYREDAALDEDTPARDDLMEGLSVPFGVANVAYPTGCRIRRIRVRPKRKKKARPQDGTRQPLVIVSRKLLRELVAKDAPRSLVAPEFWSRALRLWSS